MVAQPIEKCARDNGITEDIAPFGQTPVRGQDQPSLPMPSIDQLEERVAAADEGQVAGFDCPC